MVLKARVEKGRIRVDEPTSLPDGTVVELEVVPPGSPQRSGRPDARELRGKYKFLNTSVDEFLREKHAELAREEG